MKLDSIGIPVWQKTYGGSGNDYAYSIQQTADGGYIVAGNTASFGAGGSDAWILSLAAAESLYGKKLMAARNDSTSIQQTSDAGYIVAGNTDSFGAGSYDAWILKINALRHCYMAEDLWRRQL